MPTLCSHRHVNKQGEGSEVLKIMEIYSGLHCWFRNLLLEGLSFFSEKAVSLSFINPFIAKLMLQQCTETALHELCLFDFISLIQSMWVHLHLYKATLYNTDLSCLTDRKTDVFTRRSLCCHVRGWWYQHHHLGGKMYQRNHSPSQSRICSENN